MAFLPGGFGTADEAFEALTLIQTGKSPVLPLVMLDEPGGTYWKTFDEFIRREMVGRGMVSPNDLELYRVTDDVEQAAAEIERFYSSTTRSATWATRSCSASDARSLPPRSPSSAPASRTS